MRYAYRDARRYANLVGLTVRGTTKIWDSSLASIGLQWAKGRGDEALRSYIDLTFERFWKRELDIEDGSVLEETLAAAGIETGGFRDWAEGSGRALHDRINEDAFAAGVYGVPTYLVEDEMWFGREHLPRVAWILGGRSGPPPIVANRSFAT